MHSRRRFLATAAGVAAGMVVAPRTACAAVTERRLAFLHTHTHEQLSLAYASMLGYEPHALVQIDQFLRDFRTGDVHEIDRPLLDLLNDLARLTGTRHPFHVISGYRCAKTNEMLREHGGGGVAKYSLHMEGRAIDVRLPDVPLRQLRDAAISLRRGGVGFYPGSDFVHVDTGRVRTW